MIPVAQFGTQQMNPPDCARQAQKNRAAPGARRHWTKRTARAMQWDAWDSQDLVNHLFTADICPAHLQTAPRPIPESVKRLAWALLDDVITLLAKRPHSAEAQEAACWIQLDDGHPCSFRWVCMVLGLHEVDKARRWLLR